MGVHFDGGIVVGHPVVLGMGGVLQLYLHAVPAKTGVFEYLGESGEV